MGGCLGVELRDSDEDLRGRGTGGVVTRGANKPSERLEGGEAR